MQKPVGLAVGPIDPNDRSQFVYCSDEQYGILRFKVICFAGDEHTDFRARTHVSAFETILKNQRPEMVTGLLCRADGLSLIVARSAKNEISTVDLLPEPHSGSVSSEDRKPTRQYRPLISRVTRKPDSQSPRPVYPRFMKFDPTTPKSEQTLYITCHLGLSVYDMISQELRSIQVPDAVDPSGIDYIQSGLGGGGGGGLLINSSLRTKRETETDEVWFGTKQHADR